MSTSKQADIGVDTASPHTIKKFDLIEMYVKSWSQKLLNYPDCSGIVFIDCMCNRGVYVDKDGNSVFGTPIRVSSALSEAMKKFPNKQADLYFNDFSAEKIATLREHLPPDTDNFHIHTSNGEGNAFLKSFLLKAQTNYLLVYDPYEAAIDWDALVPFLNNWGEVIINHMVHDAVRGIPQAKKPDVIAKYEETYRANFQDLLGFAGDKAAFEQKILEIISAQQFSPSRKYYVSSFPFFNRTNNLVYKLIHHTGHIKGFKLFKETSWKVFDGKSSGKDTHGNENQFVIDFMSSGEITTCTDENCYNLNDIAKYLLNYFRGRADVPLKDVYGILDTHPIFPSDGFRPEIRRELKNYGVTISTKSMTFPN